MTTPMYLSRAVLLACCVSLSVPALADATAKKGKTGKTTKGASTVKFVNAKSDYSWVKNAAPLKGGVKTFKIGTVSTKPIKVYRLWDSQGAANKRAQEFGAYWASTSYKPEATARARLAVCWEFNHMDRLTTCTLKPNAYVAYGPGQNVKCADGKVLGGGPQQIVIANAEDLKKKGALVCTTAKKTGWTGKGFAPGTTAGGTAKGKKKGGTAKSGKKASP